MQMPSDPRFIDITGKTYGRLTVAAYAGRRGRAHYWRVRCECGSAEKDVALSALNQGRTQSCGCLSNERRQQTRVANIKAFTGARLTHGHTDSPTHRSWQAMIQRCTNPNRDNYPHYGGRGITVCERWREFSNFLQDMGVRPEGMTLDRTDNEGHYEPGNCEWVSKKQQANNRRPRRGKAA